MKKCWPTSSGSASASQTPPPGTPINGCESFGLCSPCVPVSSDFDGLSLEGGELRFCSPCPFGHRHEFSLHSTQSGAVADDDAQALAEHLHARKVVVLGEIKPVGIPPGRASIFPARRPQRSPERSVAIARRRHLAASVSMPPVLASRLTVGQLAVLKIVADEIAASGRCTLTIGEIAARAGVCHRLAQGAVRLASGDGLLVVQERRRQGQVNLPK